MSVQALSVQATRPFKINVPGSKRAYRVFLVTDAQSLLRRLAGDLLWTRCFRQFFAVFVVHKNV